MSDWKLMPCPFCGADAIMETCTTALEKVPRFRVRCKDKCAETSWDNWSEEEAAKKWNRRYEADLRILTLEEATYLAAETDVWIERPSDEQRKEAKWE